MIVYGDGSFGLNGFEFDTAVRFGLPIIGVLGNDAAWGQMMRPQGAIYGWDRLAGDAARLHALRQGGRGARRPRRARRAARAAPPGPRPRRRLRQARARERDHPAGPRLQGRDLRLSASGELGESSTACSRSDAAAARRLERHDARGARHRAGRARALRRELGPLAIVDLETTGLAADDGAEILEFGALLVDPGARARSRRSRRCVRPAASAAARGGAPHRPRATRTCADAPPLAERRARAARGARGPHASSRTTRTSSAPSSRATWTRRSRAPTYLDTLDLLALTHPDAPDLRLESFTRMLLGTEERHRALDDALDTARVIAAGRARARPRASRASSPRARALRDLRAGLALARAARQGGARRDARARGALRGDRRERGAAACPSTRRRSPRRSRDEARGRRHFPGYRVREEQIAARARLRAHARAGRGAARRGRHRRRQVARLPRGGDPLRDAARRGRRARARS